MTKGKVAYLRVHNEFIGCMHLVLVLPERIDDRGVHRRSTSDERQILLAYNFLLFGLTLLFTIYLHWRFLFLLNLFVVYLLKGYRTVSTQTNLHLDRREITLCIGWTTVLYLRWRPKVWMLHSEWILHREHVCSITLRLSLSPNHKILLLPNLVSRRPSRCPCCSGTLHGLLVSNSNSFHNGHRPPNRRPNQAYLVLSALHAVP